MKMLLDHRGEPIRKSPTQISHREYMAMKAKYDASSNDDFALENHWLNTDNLDPHSANSYEVRKRLRSRSRYEIIENNPYLKGIALTLANDFIGSGPKLKITDKRIPKEVARNIEQRFMEWSKHINLRRKLWRLRLAKLVDGEGIGIFYSNRKEYPIKLDIDVIETDRISSEEVRPLLQPDEVDGIKFDRHGNPKKYFLLKHHPGSTQQNYTLQKREGNWVKAKWIIHWFRQDRGWLRGIPETTPSLPLCALLRRYTLAVVKAAESAAGFSVLLETDGPPSVVSYGDDDDPFDMFPISHGMMTTLPWGHKMKQLTPEHPMSVYDAFVDALLKEITRPLMVPFNIAGGTSKDSNMASAVVDAHIYKASGEQERYHCEEEVLDANVLPRWWEEAIRTPGYLQGGVIPSITAENPTLQDSVPMHRWGWDRIGLDHTDPQKVANSLKTLRENKFITDRWIQETYYNRDIEDWREEIEEDEDFRQKITPEPVAPEPGQQQPGKNGQPQQPGQSKK